MTLHEMLKSKEAKKMYRELSKRYHPDIKTGDPRIMQRINKAKDHGDKAMKELYKYLSKEPKKKETESRETPSAKPKKRKYKVHIQWLKEIQDTINETFKENDKNIRVHISPRINEKYEELQAVITIRKGTQVKTAFIPKANNYTDYTSLLNKIRKKIEDFI